MPTKTMFTNLLVVMYTATTKRQFTLILFDMLKAFPSIIALNTFFYLMQINETAFPRANRNEGLETYLTPEIAKEFIRAVNTRLNFES